MGSNGASGGGGYGDAQKDRKKSVGGTRVGFEGTYKSDINPNTDPKTEKKTQVGGNGDGNQIVQSTTTPPPVAPSPTVAEVSQSTATDADVYDPRKTKRKGRSATIITSAQGVDQNFTLGKQSLLGRA